MHVYSDKDKTTFSKWSNMPSTEGKQEKWALDFKHLSKDVLKSHRWPLDFFFCCLVKGISFFLKKLFINLFGCAGSLLLHGLFSTWRARASYCGSFSCCGAQALGCVGFSCCSKLAAVVMHGLSYSMACGIFLDQGSNWCSWHCKVITTGIPGKPCKIVFNNRLFH